MSTQEPKGSLEKDRSIDEELERQQAFEKRCRAEHDVAEKAWDARTKDDPSLTDIPPWFAASHYPIDRFGDVAQIRSDWEVWKAENAKSMEAKGRISTPREPNIKALIRIRTATGDPSDDNRPRNTFGRTPPAAILGPYRGPTK